MLDRTRTVTASLGSVESVYRKEVEPLENVLMYYKNDARLVRRIATALVRESRRSDISADILLALLRYNGCVHGTNTPSCDDYPNLVFARAGRATFLSKAARTTS